MVRILTLVLAGMASTLVTADTLDDAKASGKLTLAVANEVPYGYLSSDGEPKGEAPEIALHVLDKLGIDDVEVLVTEFGSLIPGLKAGRFDVIAAGMYINPKRCQQILFSNPTYTIGEGFLVQSGNPESLDSYADVKDNGDLKLGVMAGAVEFGYAKDFGIALDQIVTLPDYPSGVAALKAGRIDALAGTVLTMAELGKKDDAVELAQPFEDLVINGEKVNGYGGFGFRPGDERLRDAFNNELGGFIGSDEHIAMVEPYGFGAHTLPGGVTAEQLCTP
ncbi:ectoine/hydroxyectoine ABC transporter substrate-binding protein EhuB [Marinobacterium nitratireducens]|uniref:Ectoine/hydroxyectoine ABC transporter substrate-binding protein EhuB n=1 Tax=Marinobacterium nitratireducens TaxID=518897 RepID=A0A917ZLN1_9GAMM|nr:ectoine/hydroxyectoine ABC transporter substrate-binding protein EhuB [Marinobacterium nitratireducens]GGO85654.1 ectoine/hydroxyectoine ABC transporter substrate-binding protein EhuB [Marinobacterium nitratireducens]